MPEQDTGGWLVVKMACDRCGNHWVAVCPMENRAFPCPKCGNVLTYDANCWVTDHRTPEVSRN